MADTIAVMNDGRVEQLGPPGRALREPAHHLRRQLPRPLQPHRGRGRRHERRRHRARRRSGSKLAAPDAARRRRDERRQGAGRVRPEKISLVARGTPATARRPQPLPGGIVPTPASSASARSTSSGCPWGPELTVFAQNIGARRAARAGRRGRPALEPDAHLRCSTPTRTSTPASRRRRAGGRRHERRRRRERRPGGRRPTHRPSRRPTRRRRRPSGPPYLLLLPGMLWLLRLLRAADGLPGLDVPADRAPSRRATRSPGTSPTTGTRSPSTSRSSCARSLYAGIATVLCLLLGYPLAYPIAFKAGRWRNLLLVLVIAPFFTSFLIRTLAWKTILADGGPVVDALLQALHHASVPDGPAAGHAARGGLRSDLQLPAVHDPAALRLAWSGSTRGCIEAAGDLYANALHDLPQGHLPAVDARRRRRARC